MNISILTTKLYIPVPSNKVVHRPRLIKRLNESLDRKMTLISSSAGFGKTTLVSEWVALCDRPVAWLSLDEGDIDATRFLSHLVAALRTIEDHFGGGAFSTLKSPQPPSIESILTILLNEVSALTYPFILVLDDYHYGFSVKPNSISGDNRSIAGLFSCKHIDGIPCQNDTNAQSAGRVHF